MRRLALNTLAAISFAVCLATIALWFRSWRGGESLERVEPNWRIVITSMGGQLSLSHWRGPIPMSATGDSAFDPPPATRGQWAHWTEFPYYPYVWGDHWWNDWGFSVGAMQIRPSRGINMHDWLPNTWSGHRRWVAIPHWSLALASSLLPLSVAFRILRRQHRQAAGRCPQCGYDLRVTPDRCPECGHIVESRTAAIETRSR